MNAPAKIKPTESAQPAGLMSALAAALPEVDGARKTAKNPHFKSNYADLASVIEAIRPVAEHGIWFRQTDIEREGGAAVETFYIGHGEEISAGITFVPADRQNAQGYGSAKTYARRYGLMTAFGIAGEDDDGNAAASAPPAKASTLEDATWAQLVQLVEATGTEAAKICAAKGVASLRDLSEDVAKGLIVTLKRRLAAQAEVKTDA